jgi:DNA-binding LacI/PurR family transcriptional regulator
LEKLMPITIRDVAKRLNLSITTVSRALDGYTDVSDATREKVIRTAEELGYVPNRIARQLRKHKSETIGYILPTSTPRFNDPFFNTFMAGLGNEATLSNYDLLVSTANPGEENERQLYKRWVQGRRVDGFILNRMQLQDWRVQYLATKNFPFVTLERNLDEVEYDSVEVNGQAGMVELIAHLVEMGHQRIAYIGASANLSLEASRFQGYQAGLAATGIEFDEGLVVEGDMTRSGGYQAAQQLLELVSPPTAIACVNDLTAIGAMKVARERGMAVGKDLAISGFDGIEEAEGTQPPLTTLSQPIYEIACQLIKLLLTRLESPEIPYQHIQFSPELFIRQSTNATVFGA